MAGLLDEPAELGDGHGAGVDPEAVDGDHVHGPLLRVEVGRSHGEFAGRDPGHPGRGRSRASGAVRVSLHPASYTHERARANCQAGRVHPHRVRRRTERRASIGHEGDHRTARARGTGRGADGSGGPGRARRAFADWRYWCPRSFLGSTNPRRTALIYLIGAIVMTGDHGDDRLRRPARRPRIQAASAPDQVRRPLGPRPAAAPRPAAYLWRRGPKLPDPAKKDKGLISRMLAKPGSQGSLHRRRPRLLAVTHVRRRGPGRRDGQAEHRRRASWICLRSSRSPSPSSGCRSCCTCSRPSGPDGCSTHFNAWLRSHGHQIAVGRAAGRRRAAHPQRHPRRDAA